jgi:hypothetical protein
VLVTERAQAVRASFLEVNELLSGLQRVVELGKTRDQVNSTYTSAGKQLEKLHLKAKIAELELQHADDVEEKAAARQVWHQLLFFTCCDIALCRSSRTQPQRWKLHEERLRMPNAPCSSSRYHFSPLGQQKSC